MPNQLAKLVSAIALASTMAASGCGSSSPSDAGAGGSASGGASSGGSSGGSTGKSGGGGSASGGASGGSSASGGNGGAGSGGSSGGQANCTNVSPCGGNVVGTWKVASSCLTLSGDLDVSQASMGCPTVPITSGSLQVSGTWTANSDGTYTDATTTNGSLTVTLSAACLTVSSVQTPCVKMGGALSGLGWNNMTCATNAGGQCICSGTTSQTGGIGLVSTDASKTGNYTTSGNDLTTDSQVDYSYCVAGNTLTMTPAKLMVGGTASSVPVTGSIVLQGTASSGTGGTPGGGGATGAGGAVSTGGKTGAGGAGGSATGTTGTTPPDGGTGAAGPCDIYAAANLTCVAAHSTVRAILSSYNGPLYQVQRASDGKTQDISVGAGGVADTTTQDTFCTGTTCVITVVYDQSGHGNFVEAEVANPTWPVPTGASAHVGGNSAQSASNATAESFTVSGHKVYSLYMKTSQAYWRNGSQSGMPLKSAPQGIYMVTSTKHYGSGCCFDYGNGETSRTYVAGPSMDAINFSSCTIWGTGAGSGPWVMADLEGGLYAKGGGGQNTSDPTQTATYVTAMEKNNGTTQFSLKGADATTGALGTYYQGSLPPGYDPMNKEGSIVLGSGGDCCYSNNTDSQGTFYEGAVVSGYPSDTTDDAVQANIVNAGYGK